MSSTRLSIVCTCELERGERGTEDASCLGFGKLGKTFSSNDRRIEPLMTGRDPGRLRTDTALHCVPGTLLFFSSPLRPPVCGQALSNICSRAYMAYDSHVRRVDLGGKTCL
ncbi:hypothetical protein RHS04_06489 [Rhizoctonia solani]|uniref:Uncharacterized protein n=1 Tax=Rhizoctonia solani TaxID=456999 RepID=A0A8H7H5B4_9AGAM